MSWRISYEEFTNELETLLRKYFGVEWQYWYDDRLTIVSQNLEKMYEFYCNESEVKEMGSCNGHQETDAEYAKRIAELEGEPCNCGEVPKCCEQANLESILRYERRLWGIKESEVN